MRARALGIAALVAVAVGPPATAEIYECVGPGGQTQFTSDPSQCPGATPRALKRQIQVADPPAASRASRERASSPRAQTGGTSTNGLEQMWRRKLAEAQAQLAEVETLYERRRAMVKACNQGSTWWGADESGIRKQIPCNDLKRELAELEEKRDALRAYVDVGIHDECRRAGCLPGWLR